MEVLSEAMNSVCDICDSYIRENEEMNEASDEQELIHSKCSTVTPSLQSEA